MQSIDMSDWLQLEGIAINPESKDCWGVVTNFEDKFMKRLTKQGNSIHVNRFKVTKLKKVPKITGNDRFMKLLSDSYSIDYLIDILKILGYKDIELFRLKSDIGKHCLLGIKSNEYTAILAPIVEYY